MQLILIKFYDRIVSSKEEPQNKHVLWSDINTIQRPVLKIYIDGKWVPYNDKSAIEGIRVNNILQRILDDNTVNIDLNSYFGNYITFLFVRQHPETLDDPEPNIIYVYPYQSSLHTDITECWVFHDGSWICMSKIDDRLHYILVILNGVDVSSGNLINIIDARHHWFGSLASFEYLVEHDSIDPSWQYTILPNPDWENNDPMSLAYIQNKPKILDVNVLNIGGLKNKLKFTKF